MIWLTAPLLLAFAALTLALWSRQRSLQQQLEALQVATSSRLVIERRQAADEERRRLLDDMHDDIGAKLLTLVHTLEKPEQADLVRAVVQDFRDLVSRSHQDACTLLQALGEIREETEARLEAMGSRLCWQQQADTPDPDLDEQQTLHLFRIAREAVTNALRHAHATQVRMRVRAIGPELVFDVTDDGPGPPPAVVSGRGIAAMRQRAQALRGNVDWEPGTVGGTKVVLRFPLPVQPLQASGS
jgi:signal transduction histidine kinase